jgi:hypothetical protein
MAVLRAVRRFALALGGLRLRNLDPSPAYQKGVNPLDIKKNAADFGTWQENISHVKSLLLGMNQPAPSSWYGL